MGLYHYRECELVASPAPVCALIVLLNCSFLHPLFLVLLPIFPFPLLIAFLLFLFRALSVFPVPATVFSHPVPGHAFFVPVWPWLAPVPMPFVLRLCILYIFRS